MRLSNKNIVASLLCSCLVLGSCFFSTVWGDPSVLGSSATTSEQIARNGGGRGAKAGANKNMNHPANRQNLHPNVRHDLNRNNYNRANYGNLGAGYGQPGYVQPGYVQPGYVQPGYVQPVVPTVPAVVPAAVPGVVNTNGVINPAYNQNPYTAPKT